MNVVLMLCGFSPVANTNAKADKTTSMNATFIKRIIWHVLDSNSGVSLNYGAYTLEFYPLIFLQLTV